MALKNRIDNIYPSERMKHIYTLVFLEGNHKKLIITHPLEKEICRERTEFHFSCHFFLNCLNFLVIPIFYFLIFWVPWEWDFFVLMQMEKQQKKIEGTTADRVHRMEINESVLWCWVESRGKYRETWFWARFIWKQGMGPEV